MKTKSTFRQDNVKINGDMRATLREVARRWPDSREGRRAQAILAKRQLHMRHTEAREFLGILGAA